MKAIFFGCLVILFGSCAKPTFDFDIKPINPDNFTMNYSWGSFPVVPDSSNKVNADIVTNGITLPFFAAAFSTNFARTVYPQNNSDSSVINITATGDGLNAILQFNLVNITGEGTYNIDNTPGLNKTVMADFAKDNVGYPLGRNTLSGTVTIDTLTSNHIHGLFTITCSSDTQTIEINNGSFTGNF